MRTEQEIRTEFEAKAEKAIRLESMKAVILAAWPESFPAVPLTEAAFGAGFMHAYKADCQIKLSAETLPDALCMAERLNPVALFRVKDGCLSYVPEPRLTEKEEEHAACINPWIYVVDGLKEHRETKTLETFTEVAGYLVHVKIEVQSDPGTHRCYDIVRQGGETTVKDVSIAHDGGHFLGRDRFWASPDQPNRFVLFC